MARFSFNEEYFEKYPNSRWRLAAGKMFDEIVERVPDVDPRLAVRLSNALARNGIEQLDDMYGVSVTEMSEWRNVGAKTADLAVQLGAVDDRKPHVSKPRKLRVCAKCGKPLPGPSHFRATVVEFGLPRASSFYGDGDTGGGRQRIGVPLCGECVDGAIRLLSEYVGQKGEQDGQ